MFGISFEHILIIGVVLLIFGPKRLPELGLTMGKAIKNFKDSISGIEEASYKRIQDPEPKKASAQAGATVQAATPTETRTPGSSDPSGTPPPSQNS